MNKLEEFRKAQALSQEIIAREMYITLSYYSKVECGHAPASRAFMQKLKATFPDADINELFFNDEELSKEVI